MCVVCVQMWGCSKGSGVPHGYKCNVTCEPPCLKLNLEQQSAGTFCIRLNASTTSMDSPSISGRGGANWKGGGRTIHFAGQFKYQIQCNITVRDFDSADVPVVTKVRQPMYTKMQLNQSVSGNIEQANLPRSRLHYKPYEQRS